MHTKQRSRHAASLAQKRHRGLFPRPYISQPRNPFLPLQTYDATFFLTYHCVLSLSLFYFLSLSLASSSRCPLQNKHASSLASWRKYAVLRATISATRVPLLPAQADRTRPATRVHWSKSVNKPVKSRTGWIHSLILSNRTFSVYVGGVVDVTSRRRSSRGQRTVLIYVLFDIIDIFLQLADFSSSSPSSRIHSVSSHNGAINSCFSGITDTVCRPISVIPQLESGINQANKVPNSPLGYHASLPHH